MGNSSNPQTAWMAVLDLVKATKDCSLDTPITNLTPDLWRTIPKDRTELSIALFQPVNIDDENPTSKQGKASSREDLILDDSDSPFLSSSSLQPLLQFRQLHHLTLTGMLESYQPLIWATCWLQPFLKILHLEMALPPLFNLDADHPHHSIDTNWSFNNACRSDPHLSEYLGHHGEGTLHDEFGQGEYLDSQAIKMAQQEVAKGLPFNNLRYLPIEKLILMNFAVDGGSIMRWFDPKRLRELEFKDGCIDAGLYLCENMQHVRITAPKSKPLYQIAREIKPGEVKLVDLKKGKITSRSDASSEDRHPPVVQKYPGLKVKVSQLMHGFGSKNKENKLVLVDKKDDGVEGL